jgi:hypothetical protein
MIEKSVIKDGVNAATTKTTHAVKDTNSLVKEPYFEQKSVIKSCKIEEANSSET